MDLAERFSLEGLFTDFCTGVARRYSIARAGIVRSNLVDEEFEMLAQWHEDRSVRTTPGRRIPREGTVGDWVLRHRRSFIGGSIDAVRRFSNTVLDFEEEGFQSNFVDFIDPDRLQLFFALSRERDAFADCEELREKVTVLPHCIRLAEHWEMPPVEEQVGSRVEKLLLELWDRFGAVPTQVQFDAAYFQALLVLSRGRIEGPGGAADLAGLKPSTLRSRMNRPKQRREAP